MERTSTSRGLENVAEEFNEKELAGVIYGLLNAHLEALMWCEVPDPQEIQERIECTRLAWELIPEELLKLPVALAKIKWDARGTRRGGRGKDLCVFIAYRVSRSGEYDPEKRQKMLARKRINLSKVRFEDLEGTWLTRKKLEGLVRLKIDWDRVKKRIEDALKDLDLSYSPRCDQDGE